MSLPSMSEHEVAAVIAALVRGTGTTDLRECELKRAIKEARSWKQLGQLYAAVIGDDDHAISRANLLVV